MITLEFSKNRKQVLHCPCGKSNADGKFTPYRGFVDKGYCHSCGETFLPISKYIKSEPLPIYGIKEKEISFIEPELVELSMSNYGRNVFFQWLVKLFGDKTATELCELYKIGTSNHWEKRGANIFWYCDSSGQYRSGKVMLYSSDGHRVRQPIEYCNWVRTVTKIDKFNFIQCFFGEHLLNKPENISKTIIIVESEKSAIVASAYFANYVWIASGGANGLTMSKSSVLEGRNIILYPDLGKFDLWSKKAEDLQSICASVKVSDFLEKKAMEEDRAGGFDIADYLIRFPLEDFLKPSQPISNSSDESFSELDEQSIRDISDIFANTNWDDDSWNVRINHESELSEIEEIERLFASIELPNGIVRINQWTVTNDIAYLIERALYNAKLTDGKPHVGRECLERLRSISAALGINDS